MRVRDEEFFGSTCFTMRRYDSLMADKTLSIIVPCWKLSRKPFWPHVLNSIVETNPYQIILINNSPRDPLNEALDKVSNALVLEPGKNIGAAAAWNLGFKASSGDCVLFSADDIVLHPQAVQKAVSLTSKDVPFVYGDYGIVRYENGKFEAVGEAKSRPFDREVLLEGIYSGYVSNYIDGASPMRRDVFPGFDTTLSRFIDWDMISRIVKAGHSGSYLPGPMFDTIDHPHRGITRNDNPPLKALKRIRKRWNIHPLLSRNQHREIELRKELLKLHQERVDLRRLFPEVAAGNLQRLIEWAERLSRLNEHEAYDLAYLRVRPYRNLLADWRNRSAKYTRLGGPMARRSELERLRTELDAIQQSAIFRIMKFFTNRIDKLLPDGTRRGEFREILVRSTQIAMDEGLTSLIRQTREKIGKREFQIEDSSTTE